MAATAAQQGIPIYSKVTTTPVNADGKVYDVPLLTIPPGTLLFRGIRIPDVAAGDDPRKFFSEYLGSVEGREMCLTPVHNTFFYPFPYVPFGIHTVGSTFNAIHVYVTMRPLNVIANVSPSKWVRGGDTRYYIGAAPYQRCDNFSYDCHTPTAQELEAKSYDNCIHPNYAQSSGVRGWMALADLDSLKPYKLREGNATTSPMGGYISQLAKRDPQIANELMTYLYTDARKHTGFPEIALYPLATHPGPRVIRRPCPDERAALFHLEKLANVDELNYMPLATITSEGVADTVKGYYGARSIGELPARADGMSIPTQQQRIEQNLKTWLHGIQTAGIKLPGFKTGSLAYDTRTGFFVLPQLLLPTLSVEGAPGEPAVPYSSLLIKLNSTELKERAREYAVLFRTFLPEKYMEKFGLAPKFGIRRAMVLSRPGFFKRWFEELKLTMPPALEKMGKRASVQFELNSKRASTKAAAKPSEAGGGAASAAAGAPLFPGATPPGTPPGSPEAAAAPPPLQLYGVAGGTPPGTPPGSPPAQGEVTPNYGAAKAAAAGVVTPIFSVGNQAGTPNYGRHEAAAAGVKTPVFSGGASKRKTRSSKKSPQRRQTRRRAVNTSSTLSSLNMRQLDVVKRLPALYKALWASRPHH
jgi:hypothetical protein